MFDQAAQQDNQALSLPRRQCAPIDRSLARHAGDPAISQVPTTPYNPVLATFVGLSKTHLWRFS
jgi:hypothetical protein